jgi:A/G-specific adenine glycosylase
VLNELFPILDFTKVYAENLIYEKKCPQFPCAKSMKSRAKNQAAYKIKTLKIVNNLEEWFQAEQRDLPWRKKQNPYHIWISEIMLQQTQVITVIPFFERFVERFPTPHHLAQAHIEEVYPLWAGLGYYSRARNLIRAAKELVAKYSCDCENLSTWPQTWSEWILLPGIGPYTSRAVSSIALGQKVGVVDGNVHRVLSRILAHPFSAYSKEDQKELQRISDLLVQNSKAPGHFNQSLMELGARVCTPKSPSCSRCPVQLECLAFRKNQVDLFPIPRARKVMEIWSLTFEIPIRRSTAGTSSKRRSTKIEFGLVQSRDIPFLKNQWVFPARAKKLKERPQDFSFTHSITHHKIFVRVKIKKETSPHRKHKEMIWVCPSKLRTVSPSKLLQKALQTLNIRAGTSG